MNFENIIQLETMISDEIKKDNGATLNFNYETTPDGVTVRVFTMNPKTKEFFLLSSATGPHQEVALNTVLNYVKNHKREMNSYTVKWRKKNSIDLMKEKNQEQIVEDSPSTILSHFSCKNVIEVVEKFFEGKDSSMYIVYEIKLNPIA